MVGVYTLLIWPFYTSLAVGAFVFIAYTSCKKTRFNNKCKNNKKKLHSKLRIPSLLILFTTIVFLPWLFGVYTFFHPTLLRWCIQRAMSQPPPPVSSYIQYKPAQQPHLRVVSESDTAPSIPGYPDEPKGPNDKPLIAIAAPSRSRPTWTTIDDAEVVRTLIPSLIRTVTDLERSRYRFKLYIGVDDDDEYWTAKAHQEHIHDQVPTWLAIEILVFENQNKIPFNRMMRKTYDDGAEFMIRINDDSEFWSSEWATKGIEMLASYSPPWVGVVGAVETNVDNFSQMYGRTIGPPPNLLPHDFTHRVHMEIFEQNYYPEEFANWFIDDWITRVYGKARTTKLLDWTLYHHAQDPRYWPRRDQLELLAPTLHNGQRKIMKWFKGQCEKGDSLWCSQEYKFYNL